jgi:CTP:molybdopterin cytidylyltransferase MocA
VLLEHELFPRLLGLRGDVGAHGVLADVSVCDVACDDIADPIDVDRRPDLRALEARDAG